MADNVEKTTAPLKPRAKSKLFTRLSQAHEAIGIKDDDTTEPSKIDERLRAAPNRPKLHSAAAPNRSKLHPVTNRPYHNGSTCSTNSSSCGGPSVLARYAPVLEASQMDDCAPAKPVRQKSKKTVEKTVETSSNQISKRKRYGSPDVLSNSVKLRQNGSSDTPKKDPNKKDPNKKGGDKFRNRFSALIYNSMRGSKRGDDSSSELVSLGETSDTTSKTLRHLEEETCVDVAKLLQNRVKELRKVGGPDNHRVRVDEREEFPLFEFVCEVSLRRKGESVCPYISWSHPPLCVIEEEKQLLASINSLPMFCFPDMDLVHQVKKMRTETYCFVFTDLQAQNKFGYCRRFLPASKAPNEKSFPVVYCMVTKLRSFETFSKVFDQVVELRNYSSAGAYSFLKALIEQNAPRPARSITVKYINAKIGNLVDIVVERVTSDQRFENVDLVYVIEKLGTKLLVEIFINLLVERKLLFVAESLSDLTTIIHAIMQLVHPLQWQGIYVPVLPKEIIDATSSPVPYVIGILKQHYKLMDEEALDDECNIVYISEKKIVKRPNFTDIPFNKKFRKTFLGELKTLKRKVLKQERTPQHTVDVGNVFFELMRTLIGHYEDHVTFETGESDIDMTSFSDAAGLHSEFVWQMSKTQMFSSFIQALTVDGDNNSFKGG